MNADWITLAVLAGVLGLLVLTRYPPHLVLMAAVAVLLTTGVLGEQDVLRAAANPAVGTIALLFPVVAGLRETGAVTWLAGPLLGRPASLAVARARLLPPVALLSAFVSNTALVAVLVPVVADWARQHGMSVSRLLIPLSYASILGGGCTLIGTTTVLLANGLIVEAASDPSLGLPAAGLGMFEIGAVGLPCALAGLAFLLVAGRLLPERQPVIGFEDDARQYTVEMLVDAGSPLAGRTIEEAGLRHLPGLYLMEIDRGDQVLAAPSHNVRLCARDRLVFAGVVESVVDLQRIRGLSPATDPVFSLGPGRGNRLLVEAVVSDTNPLVGVTIRDGRFRTRYNAAVIAVARGGQRLKQKSGDVALRPGDTLLLEARPAFVEQQRNSRDFYLVSAIEDSAPPRHDRAPVALAILGGLVGLVVFADLGIFNAAMLAAGAMIATRCCSAAAALRAVDWQVLIVVAAAVGIGRAMELSSAAARVAAPLIEVAGTAGPGSALALILAVTLVLTNLINAKAAAALMFPVALTTARALSSGLEPVSAMPFAMAITLGATASFASPVGYQTNLMVYGPGGYRFADYVRVGLPLTLVVGFVAWLAIPRVWPF